MKLKILYLFKDNIELLNKPIKEFDWDLCELLLFGFYNSIKIFKR